MGNTEVIKELTTQNILKTLWDARNVQEMQLVKCMDMQYKQYSNDTKIEIDKQMYAIKLLNSLIEDITI